jgi:hypothetical protein
MIKPNPISHHFIPSRPQSPTKQENQYVRPTLSPLGQELEARPTIPPFRPPRPLTDIPRVALVAFSSHAKERFQSYLKPDLSLYPTDTLASYRVRYRRAILDVGLVVIVAEDYLDEAEDEDGGTHPLVREIAANERKGRGGGGESCSSCMSGEV